MDKEDSEKPDWLNDFQNNQATSGKQTSSLGKLEIAFDTCRTENTYVSPRYGRRSVPGAKSVENSPKKGLPHKERISSVRSSSARPDILSQNLSVEVNEDEKIELISPQSNIKNDSSETALNKPYLKINEFSRKYDNLEDLWHSLNIFNANQKGRLGSTGKYVLSEKGEKDTFVKHKNHEQALFESKPEIYENLSSKNLGNIKPAIEPKKFSNAGAISGVDTTDFIIPELPQGKHLVFNIKTTWGDRHYLGLNGIEMFNSKGKKIQAKSIAASPPDINILSEYSKDPRVVTNLIDNVYLTQDDIHMWLAPFTPNKDHFIFIEFHEIEELAMLRVWNYNKSRIHCFRGVKDIEVKLDDKFIFIGEIARASGEILNTLNCLGDTILFTTDEIILESVAENDEYYGYSIKNHLEGEPSAHEELRPFTGFNAENSDRPFTCSKNPRSSILSSNDKHKSQHNEDRNSLLVESKSEEQVNLNLDNQSLRFSDKDVAGESSPELQIDFEKFKKVMNLQENVDTFLPAIKISTDEVDKNNKLENKFTEKNLDFSEKYCSLFIPSVSILDSDSVYETLSMPTGYIFTILIHSTWGDLYYVGLNGLQVFDENGTEHKLYSDNISAVPESVNVLDGIDNDIRTPDKLIDGITDSMDGCHSWLAPVLPLTINKINITFQNPVTLSSFKLWNYTKTPNRGVREFGIMVDGLLIYNGELEQAIASTDGVVSEVPYKVVNFSDSSSIETNINCTKYIKETSNGNSPDQTQRPLTTMTYNS